MKIFGTPLNWNLNPNSELLTKRVEELRPLMLGNLAKKPLPSELKHGIDSPQSSPKRVKVESPEPVVNAVFDDPMHVDAVFTADNPKTPELLPVNDAPAIVIPTVVTDEDVLEILSAEKTDIKLETLPITVSAPPAFTPAVPEPKLPFRVLNGDLNKQYSLAFTGKFLITPPDDAPPSEEEYVPIVIEPRVKEQQRKTQQPKRYNDEDFEDLDDEGNLKKPTKGRKKSATLESQFGIEKGRVILREVTDTDALKLLEKKGPAINLCDPVANRQLTLPKSLKCYIPVQVGDYYHKHILNTPTGVFLASLFKLSFKNLLRRSRGLVQMPAKKVKIPSGPEETRKLAELYDPERMYRFLNALNSDLRTALQKALPKFIHYRELLPVKDIPNEKLPRNALELVLLYNEFRAVHDSGLDPDSLYLIEFREPFELRANIPASRTFRVKYQHMIQFHWLYFLLNPQKLINSITSRIILREEPTIERIVATQQKYNVEAILSDMVNATKNGIVLDFLETYITFMTNAESLFGIDCHKKLFKHLHITVELPRSQSLSSFVNITSK